MKRNFQKALATLIIFLVPIFYGLADPPGPPDPGGNPTGGGGVPVGAPIDNGTIMLIAMGAGYILVKYLRNRKSIKEVESPVGQQNKQEMDSIIAIKFIK